MNAALGNEDPAKAGGAVDFASVLKQLGATVLAPLIVGQIIQWFFTEPVAKFKVKFRLSDVSSFMLLTMVWSVFSDAVYAGSFAAVKATDIVAVAIINAGFYILFSLVCMTLARLPLPRWVETPDIVKRLRYSREDTVAIMVNNYF
jgi:sodium/bile acid cotransporter 7